MEKMLIIKPNNTIELAEYTGFDSLHNAVGDIECFSSMAFPFSRISDSFNDKEMSFYCNDEFLYNNDLDKVNALSVVVTEYSQPIYGDVAVLNLLPDGEEKGFNEIEAKIIAEAFSIKGNVMSDTIDRLHKMFDGNENKPEPYFEVISM